jgi:hypothetical protein
MRNWMMIALTVLLGLLLVACDGGGDPAETVERYLQAKVDGDADTVRALLCAEMEAELEREIRTFESVSGVELQNMACERVDNSNRVACDGTIVALYGEEETEFPLVTYRVVQEDGEWKWCGEG